MNKFVYQRGVGLVEVLVAVLLLAVAVLGFSAMQLNAVKATDESLMRTHSISMIKALSESMRILPNSSSVYREELSKLYDYGVKTNSGYIIGDYCAAAATYKTTTENCNASNCTTEQIVKFNVGIAVTSACAKDIALNAQVCPGTSGVNQRQCIIASWGQTKPTMNDEKYSCITESGAYKPGSSCFIMEAY